MNAALVQSFDVPPSYASFKEPVATDGEVLVDVVAAGLHQIVKALARGAHYGSSGELPFVPGVDGVGRLQDGTRVYFMTLRPPYGSMAERSITKPGMYLPLPNGLDEVTAAGSANAAMSSWVALTARARFVAGESVLILGATGVAGRLAIQIAKRLGARRVVAAGRNPASLEPLKALGADAVIATDLERESLIAAYRSELPDVVLDYLWGQPAEILLEAISQKGLHQEAPRIRYVEIGGSAGPAITLPGAALRSSGLELLGSGFGSASTEQILKALSSYFESAATEPFQFDVKAVPLRDVESSWNSDGDGVRLVFQP